MTIAVKIRRARTVTIRKAADHPVNQSIALSSLTKSFVGAGGVHLSMWPGWWDPTASLTTDTGGTGAAVRTNQTGARITFPPFTGSRIFGVKFDSTIWSSVNALGLQWIPRPSYWRFRYLKDGVYTAWTYGVRPSTSPAGAIFSHDLDPASTYQAELEPTHFTDFVNFSAAGAVPLGDYMREPEITGTANYPATEQGAFQQISAMILGPGATYGTITYTGTSKKIDIIGDSNVHGAVVAQTGAATVDIASANEASATTTLDARGHAITGVRQAIENYCTANGYRPIINSISYGGLFLGDITDSIYSGYASVGAHGLATPPIARYAKRTGYFRVNASPPYVQREGRAMPSGWAPDLVVVALVTNDQLLATVYNVFGTGSEEYQSFAGNGYRDDVKALANAIHATYPSAKILMVNNHLSDNVWSVPTIDTHAKFNEACGSGHLNFPQSWGRSIDIRAVISTSVIPDDATSANNSIHYNATAHTAVAAALATPINALAP